MKRQMCNEPKESDLLERVENLERQVSELVAWNRVRDLFDSRATLKTKGKVDHPFSQISQD